MIESIQKLSTTQKAIVALMLILPAPLLGIFASLYSPSIGDVEIGQGIWLFLKVWLIVLPVLWLLYIDGGKLSWSPSNSKGVIAGLVWSVPVGLIIFMTYWIAKGTLIDPEAKQIIEEMGLSSLTTFLIFASAMSLGNSLMEEYVWRWFVFSKFKILVGVWPAIVLSAFFFTVHHTIILWNFGSLWLVFLGSMGLFFGGIIWAWLYNKYNSIWPGWICHVTADSVIMWITWEIIVRN
jgi:membrane protease YdiL (CAAX protease family)